MNEENGPDNSAVEVRVREVKSTTFRSKSLLCLLLLFLFSNNQCEE